MVGFSLAHGYFGFLLLFPTALFLWIVSVGITLMVWRLRRQHVAKTTWLTLVAAILTLGLLSIPQSFFNWAFADQLAHSSHAADLLANSAANGRTRTVLALLARGVSINARNYEGDTPLSLAAAACRPALLAELIKRGADLNATNLYGDSPLQRASSNHCLAAADILQSHGALNLKGTPEQRQSAVHEIVSKAIKKQSRP